MSLLGRSGVRYVLRHPWQFGLAVLGVAMGAAIVVATDLAIASARAAFRVSVEAVAGAATHQVRGGVEGVTEDAYVRLRLAGVRPIAPVLEGYIGLAAAPGRTFQLLGIDAFAEAPIRPFLAPGAGAGVDVLLRPGTAWVGAATAAQLDVAAGDVLVAESGGRLHTLTVGAVLEPGDRLGAQALESLVVADIATAQAVLGRTGVLDRIDVVAPEGAAAAALLDRVRSELPPGAVITETGRGVDVLDRMTRAFRLNLQALSLLVLLFALFFIHNAMTFAVVQRRERIATLRTLGVTRGGVFRHVLAEAALLGGAGALIGVPLGVLLGGGFVQLVAGTISDLYFAGVVRDVGAPASSLLKGAALALGGSVLAALPAAAEASAARPGLALARSSIESRARRRAPILAAGGVLLGAGGAALLLVPALAVNFAGLFLIVIGCAVMVPAALLAGMRAASVPAAGVGGIGRLVPGSIAAALSRTAPAGAALMVAIATAVALGVMIGSFRDSVAQWLNATLNADAYVSVPGPGAGRPAGVIDDVLAAALLATPGVLHAAAFRSVTLETGAEPLRVGVLEPDARARLAGAPRSAEATRHAYAAYTIIDGDAAAAWRTFEGGTGVLISEPLSRRLGLRRGGVLELPAAGKSARFTVAGVYRDYGNDRGAALLHADAWSTRFGDPGIGSLALVAQPGVPPAVLVERLRERTASGPQRLLIRSDRALRDASLEVFDRTFLITWVLRLLAVVVAFIGILAALAALQLERAREMAVLRATGVTRAQVRALVLGQSGLLGAAAGLLALPVGLLLAAIMVHVINVRSFGWTIEMRVDAATLAQSLALAIGAALLAGAAPAWRMANAPIAAGLREE